jgi:two-component system OmpR family sensor kinase
MTLRLRLGLLLTCTVLVGFLVFGGTLYWLFVRQQQQQLHTFIERDLSRLQSVFENPTIGAALLDTQQGEFEQQLVAATGEIILPFNAQAPLPLHAQPVIDRSGPVPRLLASRPWLSATGQELGTIRVALDISDALAARDTLLSSLLLSGSAIFLVTLLTGLVILQNALVPLLELATKARRIDPAKPQAVDYTGPNDEVADVAHALNAALRGIRERQEAERASLAEVAHELAAPLTLVAGHLDALVARGHDPRLQAAREAARELLYTSQDLLTLARGELERPLDLEIFDLADVVRRIGWEYPGVEVEAADHAEIAGSPQRLAQLVRNLVRNAVQAAEGPHGVSLHLITGEELQIQVRDHGPGITPEDLPHIFDRFYTRRGGVGVGLSVSRQIAESHGGRITVTSDLQNGTVFTVTLPSLQAQLATDSSETADEPTARVPARAPA